MHIKQSISLTNAEAKTLNAASDFLTPSWSLSDATPMRDENGKISGYKATVSTNNKDNKPTGAKVEVFSSATFDKNGEASPSNIWTSKAYKEEAEKAEKNNK